MGAGERLNTIEEEERQFDTHSNTYKTGGRVSTRGSPGDNASNRKAAQLASRTNKTPQEEVDGDYDDSGFAKTEANKTAPAIAEAREKFEMKKK
jgi:hypothetical protein